jgi:putative tryptophan/tyrosine transport system substrate-binding protein
MRRRHFIRIITLASASAVVPPRLSIADAVKTLGAVLPWSDSDPIGQELFTVFRNALAQRGWREGGNLRLLVRWSGGDPEHERRDANEVVGLAPDAILAPGPSFVPVREATRRIPIVFAFIADPVGQGLVSSLAHPGGNATGFTLLDFPAGGKFVEILKTIAPETERVLVLLHPDYPSTLQWWRTIEGAARGLGLVPKQGFARNSDEIATVLRGFAAEAKVGLILEPTAAFIEARAQIIATAAAERIPAVYWIDRFVKDGGLVSYGIDPADQMLRAADYIDRIFKGEKAGELPVQNPTKFQLAINVKTAKALGLTVPTTLLATADEVIE